MGAGGRGPVEGDGKGVTDTTMSLNMVGNVRFFERDYSSMA